MKVHRPDKQSAKLTLVRETLTQQICNLLKRKILDGILTSGMRIWADNLAQELEVSVAPVKEALLILSGEGLIRNIPRRGSLVRQFSVREMHELYQMRRLLEVEALQIMFDKNLITDEFVDELQIINRQIGRQIRHGEFSDRNAAFELDWEFHQKFMHNCQHNLLIELYSRLNTQAQIIRFSSWNIGPRGDKTFNEHDALVGALTMRDLAAAKLSVAAHLGSILTDFDQTFNSSKGDDLLSTATQEQLPNGSREPE